MKKQALAPDVVEAPPAIVIDPAGGVSTEKPHPALDPGPSVTSTDTQNAREMNTPADSAAIYSGAQLAVTPPVEAAAPAPPGYSGAALLTTAQEAARRAHLADSEERTEH